MIIVETHNNKNEILVKSVNEVINQYKNLNEKNWIKLIHPLIDDFNIIICKSKFEFFKGIYATTDYASTIYFEDPLKMLHYNCIIPKTMLTYYLEQLTKTNGIYEVRYITLMMSHHLIAGDKIYFPNGKIGIIQDYKTDYGQYTNVKYKLLKKSGELGVKDLTLYGNADYKIEGKEFVDYKKQGIQ